MSRLKNLTFNASVVHPPVLLQDSNGGTRQRQYMEQGETGIQTSCLDLQRTKATFHRPLPMTIQYRFRNHILHAIPPDLQSSSTYLKKKQKNHNLAQRKHNISARSLLPLINYLEHYVILRCPCLEPNAS
jgi:hypothetical protein